MNKTHKKAYTYSPRSTVILADVTVTNPLLITANSCNTFNFHHWIIFNHKKLFMKKLLFPSASGLIFSALLLSIGFISCKKETATIEPVADSEPVAQKGKTNTIPVVSLKLTVNEAGNRITDDDGGDYISGFQNVSARFDEYGNFIFSCGLGGRGNNTYLVRWLNIDFSSPVVVYTPPPITGADKVRNITTIPVAAYTFTPFQNMTVGQSQCVGLTGGEGAEWIMNFHRSAEDVSTSPSAYAVFTRTSSTQWTVTPAGTCSPNSNVCALRNGPDVLYGYYNMPFSFTLTKL
jgi:hypothetical protein